MARTTQNVKYDLEKTPAGNVSSGHRMNTTMEREPAQIQVIL